MRPAKARALVTNAWAFAGRFVIYTTTTSSSFRNNLWQP